MDRGGDLKFAYKMIRIAMLAILALLIMMIFSSYIHKKTIGHMEEINKIDQKELKAKVQRVAELEAMIERDDKLLNFLLQDTWDRDCVYRREPWMQLADGKIRQQLIQECEED